MSSSYSKLEIHLYISDTLYAGVIKIHTVILLLLHLLIMITFFISLVFFKCFYNTLKRFIYLEYADPVLRMWFNELRQGVMTLQSSVGQVTLPHILEDDVGKVRCVHVVIK